MLWCDRSVATLFSLRYNSPLASRFDSKNNSGKRVAYVMLAAVLSVEMQREFVAKQVQDKKQKKNNVEKKPKDAAASLEAGFNSIKEGLMFLGSSLSGVQPQAAPGATLDDVLTAIKAQSDTMTQLLAHLVAQKKD
ncbi:hypothetical protein DYB34_010311 [Aphanomyces astaci]|uniref:Uncharacterized protein n=1 Tax=Aphanomyces astaci TaxID=112090 RepID=A0A3R6WF71_APHAT|nr:hypothetical protein DYB34_010311 [Aphanomyces astaci]